MHSVGFQSHFLQKTKNHSEVMKSANCKSNSPPASAPSVLLTTLLGITTVLFASLYLNEVNVRHNASVNMAPPAFSNTDVASRKLKPLAADSSVTVKTLKSKSSKKAPKQILKSVSRIQFDDAANTLFVADWKQEMIFAFELVSTRFQQSAMNSRSQSKLSLLKFEP